MVRKSTWALLAATIVMATIASACASATAGNGIITGTLSTNDAMSLPNGATATVELVRGNDVVSRTSFTTAGGQPIPFTLSYNPTDIQTSMSHALRARVVGGGSAAFSTQADTRYDFDGMPVALYLARMDGGSGTSGTPRR